MESEIWCYLWCSICDGKTTGINGQEWCDFKANVKDVKIIYPVNELIKCLHDDKCSEHASKCCVHLNHLEDLFWVIIGEVLPVFQDHNVGSSRSTSDIDQIAHNMSSPAANYKVHVLDQMNMSVYQNVVQTLPLPTTSTHERPWLLINNNVKVHPLNSRCWTIVLSSDAFFLCLTLKVICS